MFIGNFLFVIGRYLCHFSSDIKMHKDNFNFKSSLCYYFEIDVQPVYVISLFIFLLYTINLNKIKI